MSILKSLATNPEIANERDSLGGARLLESGTYGATVMLAYVTKANSGALALNLVLKTESGQEIKQALWMTSGTTKGCKNYYEDKHGGKQYLPGFLLAQSLTLLTIGKEIGEMETEEKVVKLYSSEAKAEVPTKVDMLTDLLGKDIIVGVIKQVVDKTQKVEGSTEYVPTGETREENEIDKFFRSGDKLTVAEIRAQAQEAAFYVAWNDKWSGKVKERAKGAVGNTGTAGAPKGAGPFGAPKLGAQTANKPTTSLFS